MPDPRRHRESIRGAIELVTAWLDRPDGPPDVLLETLQRHIEEHPSSNRLNGAVELIMGLTHLCGALLALRELDEDIPSRQTIQALALEQLVAGDDYSSSRPTQR